MNGQVEDTGPIVKFPDATLSLGPVKWHKACSRYHEAGAPCGLIAGERKAKSGRKVTRLAHTTAHKQQRKTRARRT